MAKKKKINGKSRRKLKSGSRSEDTLAPGPISSSSQVADNRYQYRTLNSQHREIRLIRYLSGLSDSNDIFSITHWSIGAAPSYVAMSYAWGDSTRSNSILVDGKTLPVTANLHDVLSYGRVHPEVYLWADAVCIDQDNLEERASQVCLMRDIYEKADKVVAWLDNSATLEHAQETIRNLQIMSAVTAFNNGELLDIPFPALQDPYRLLASPWFSRSWIVQEAVVNKSLNMWYSGVEFPFSLFETCLDMGHYSGLAGLDYSSTMGAHKTLAVWRNSSRMETMNVLRYRYLRSLEVPLVDALCLVRNNDSTDPRDKVYACLGLTNPKYLSLFQPNYEDSNTVSRLFQAVARQAIDEGFGHLILALAGISQGSQQLYTPSWVVNWAFHSMSSGPTGAYNYNYMGKARSSKSIRCQGEIVVAKGVSIGSILLHGALFQGNCPSNVYTNVLDPMRSSKAVVYEQIVFVVQMAIVLAMLCANSPAYPTVERAVDAAWRTLTADRFHNGYSRRLRNRDRFQFKTLFPEMDFGKEIHTQEPSSRHADETSTDTLGHFHSYARSIHLAHLGRRFGYLENGYIGIFPAEARPKDTVIIVCGADSPFVLRKTGSSWILVGECYIHGVMDGEVNGLDAVTGEFTVLGQKPKEFVIV